MAATIQRVRAALVELRLELDQWPDHHAVRELRAEVDDWIHQLDTGPVEQLEERFVRVDRFHVQLQRVAAILEEWDGGADAVSRKLYQCSVCGMKREQPVPITVQVSRPDERVLVLLVCSAPCLIDRLTALRFAALVEYYDTCRSA